MEKLKTIPEARAQIRGGSKYPGIKGKVEFYEAFGGTVVMAEISGLTPRNTGQGLGFYGFHIHEGSACTGTTSDEFADTDGHYQTRGKMHPEHEGDLPPLLSDKGTAWMMVYTTRFFPEEVVGKTVVIHDMPDDFRTQPSGNSGEKIACGQIVAEDPDIR